MTTVTIEETKKRSYTVSLFEGGENKTPAKIVGITAALADIGAKVEKFKGHDKVCCWEAADESGEVVAWRGCAR